MARSFAMKTAGRDDGVARGVGVGSAGGQVKVMPQVVRLEDAEPGTLYVMALLGRNTGNKAARLRE